MNIFFKKIIIAALFGMTPFHALFAQYYNNPALHEVIAPDARAAGMADIGVATSPDVFSQHWNLAKYAFSKDTGAVGFSYTPWTLRINQFSSPLFYLAGFYKIGQQAISASVRYLSDGSATGRDALGNAGGSLARSYYSFDLGYSHTWGKYISLGLALRYIASSFNSEIAAVNGLSNTGALAGDIGFYFRYPSKKTNEFALGLSLKNMGMKVTEGSTKRFLPMAMNIGFRYSWLILSQHQLAIALDINKPLVPTDQTKTVFGGFFAAFGNNIREWGVSGALEYSFIERFFARAGYHLGDKDYALGSYFSTGLGAKWHKFSIDASYLVSTHANEALSNTVRIGIQYAF
ncbi:MAG: PorV/PorQ family protein [Prevotellaceae bacterium]|jgi:hypothetical protein|nr:PorV/PorQ family protein [Prevotellaceae bacterium]